jgi:hypothetical protein
LRFKAMMAPGLEVLTIKAQREILAAMDAEAA